MSASLLSASVTMKESFIHESFSLLFCLSFICLATYQVINSLFPTPFPTIGDEKANDNISDQCCVDFHVAIYSNSYIRIVFDLIKFK